MRVTAVDHRPTRVAGASRRRAPGATVRAYIALTKPRIIELLLVTTLPTMALAARGLPPIGLVLATLGAGALAAGAANSLNCYLDRDIDAVMRRTGRRPLATAAVSPREALVFGCTLAAVAVTVMAVAVNALAAGLTLVAILFYVLVYTLGLKRRTPSNIVWGGAAGCMPVLIGWAAVTGTLAWAPFVLFLVVFFWTPPHYWPLAMRFRDDYLSAGVPMLPVVAAPAVVTRRIVGYSWAMVACSLLLWPVADTSSWYVGAALLLGAAFLREAHQLHRVAAAAGDARLQLQPMRLFHASITYLALLFLAVGLDAVLLG